MVDFWVQMIDAWVKFVSIQCELALNLTRAVLEIGGREAPESLDANPEVPAASDQVHATESNVKIRPERKTKRQEERLEVAVHGVEALRQTTRALESDAGAGELPSHPIESRTDNAQPAAIPGILSFLESSQTGATVREIAEHLQMDKKTVLPLMKALVKEKKIDELLGRYCVLKS